jgi:hypothetical protein
VQLRFGFYFWYLLLANLAVAGLVAAGLALVIVPWLRRWGLRVIAWALLLDILSTSSARSATRSSRR